MDKTLMKAVRYTRYGPPPVLQLQAVEKPRPRRNEVRVNVYASTVSAGTLWLRKGRVDGSPLLTFFLRLMFGLRGPRRQITGYEFSGVVEACGEDVTQFRPGDAVYGTTTGLKQGAYAEYVCVPEKRKGGVLMHKPAALRFSEAAALPVGAMTALQLLQRSGLDTGRKILIYGASGSVGSYAVQLAKYFGAQVTAVCSTANTDLVKNIGADKVFDYTQTHPADWGGEYDVFLEAVNKLPRSKALPLLKKGGRFISVTSPTKERSEYLLFLHRIIEAGHLKPIIDRCYPLEEIVEAHTYADAGHKKGNVVIYVTTKARAEARV
ncbi:MAG: NAD(P)-dependent alcohol dehydrogenase [Flavobacteriales bacterium]